MTDFSLEEPLKSSLSTTPPTKTFSSGNRHARNKSVQWADWELKDVMDFTGDRIEETHYDACCQTELQDINVYNKEDPFSLIDTIVQTSAEINSIASQRSTCSSVVSYSTEDGDDDHQAALSDLITHLEDTAALLRDHLLPVKSESITSLNIDSFEQTTFLLKYQLVLVSFTQIVSILLLSLFDHLIEKEHDTGYKILTVSCGAVLQILNMILVVFATAVLSRQMMRYTVEGPLMAKTYLATVITFAGLYFIIFRIEPSSWDFGTAVKFEEYIAAGQFIKMLYLSVSAATLCGAANIQPNAWYVTLILCFQSLINFVYFASILAQTIGNYHSYTVQVRRSSSTMRGSRSKS